MTWFWFWNQDLKGYNTFTCLALHGIEKSVLHLSVTKNPWNNLFWIVYLISCDMSSENLWSWIHTQTLSNARDELQLFPCRLQTIACDKIVRESIFRRSVESYVMSMKYSCSLNFFQLMEWHYFWNCIFDINLQSDAHDSLKWIPVCACDKVMKHALIWV